MATRPCCFLSFFFAAVSVSRPVLHCTTACWRLERLERESAAAACEVYSRSCQSGSGTTAGAGIGVLCLFSPVAFCNLAYYILGVFR